MKIDDLAKLMGKSRNEVEELLKNNEVIELKLSERRHKQNKDDDLRIYE